MAILNFIILSDYDRGGNGKGKGDSGANGTITGKACPKGLYGTFCEVYFICTFPNSVIFPYLCALASLVISSFHIC